MYAMNRLKIDNLTQAHLVEPVYELLKGTCTSIIELEYNMEDYFKALIDKLDWNNPERDRYPFDLTKPLPLKDLEKKYTASITKTKEAQYEIVGIEDAVKKLHGYGHLEEIVVKRADRHLYKFKEGDFVDLHLNDIEDILLLVVQHKLFRLNESGIQTFPEIKFKELYTSSYKPPGVIYEDLVKQKWVMWADELYKFSDGTLKKVRDKLRHRIPDFRLGYNDEMSIRKWTAIDKKRSELMVELIDK
ncbi:hypothetical protein Tco_0619593 [Tanacetum coccineum]